MVSRKENIMSKKFKLNFNEEQVVEAEIVGGGYIRWNVYFTSGVSAPLKTISQDEVQKFLSVYRKADLLTLNNRKRKRQFFYINLLAKQISFHFP